MDSRHLVPASAWRYGKTVTSAPPVVVNEDGSQRCQDANQQEECGDNLQATVQMLVRDLAEVHPVPAALGGAYSSRY